MLHFRGFLFSILLLIPRITLLLRPLKTNPMISTSNISLQYGKRVLFDEVNIKFSPGNCYGVIGANGAGKSTFLKILSGEISANKGQVVIEKGKRMAVLKQDHSEYNEVSVLHTTLMGHTELWKIMSEKDALYAKPDFSDADGMKASELEAEFAEMDGWNAESDSAELLSGLGIPEKKHDKLMMELSGSEKVRVLLAQALFGNPDILILDEPTNDLDIKTISWLENFLIDFKNTVIVVSHDRHFLDAICTHVADIDFSEINIFPGNYTFWYESSQLALSQKNSINKKAEDKKKELEDFVRRFSANASKSKQATSRKKLLDKLTFEDIKPSSRRYPAIIFEQRRPAGDQILHVENLSAESGGDTLFTGLNLNVRKGDKIALISNNGLAVSTFFRILMNEVSATAGDIKYGQTITPAFLPNENEQYFKGKDMLIDWLREYSPDEKDDVYIRGFLGKMLFSGEDVFKLSNVLSGGEKVRCMLSKMMLAKGNLLILDEPTNHLDMESITAFNEALQNFPGTILFTSHDHTFTQSIANRIVEIGPNGFVDKLMKFDEYLEKRSSFGMVRADVPAAV